VAERVESNALFETLLPRYLLTLYSSLNTGLLLRNNEGQPVDPMADQAECADRIRCRD
jgi:hypothetical protein